MPTCECKWCGSPFEPKTVAGREKLFCDDECKALWHKATRLLGESIAAPWPPGVLKALAESVGYVTASYTTPQAEET